MAKRLKVLKGGSTKPAAKGMAVVGSATWKEVVPAHIQEPLQHALEAMEARRLPDALHWFGVCDELQPFCKPVIYFGAQVAEDAYRQIKAEKPFSPVLAQWKEIVDTLIHASAQIAPDDAVAQHNYGRWLQDEGDVTEAMGYYRKAVRLNPTQSETWGNMGLLTYETGDPTHAWHHWQKALSCTPSLASAKVNQAFIQLRSGDYLNGWWNLAARWDDLNFTRQYGRPDLDRYGKHWRERDSDLWRHGGLPRGAKILFHGEQGLGDHVQFVRYLQKARALGLGIAGLETRPILKRWMEASLAELCIPVFSRDVDELPEYTHHCSTMDLPYLLGTTLETIPPPIYPGIGPLKALHDVRGTLDVGAIAGLAVGIAWEGAKGNPADAQRSIPAEQLRHLANIPGVTWVNLQFAPDAAITARAWLGNTVVDGTEDCADVLDTAAVVRGLDMVITVDTLTAHLAGTLGIPTLLLHRFCREWRWGDQTLTGETNPWYPSVRSWDVPRPNDWASLLTRVRTHLEDLAR